MSITVSNGAKTWIADIDKISEISNRINYDVTQDFIKSFKETVAKSYAYAVQNIVPDIAKDKGLMRRAFEQAFELSFVVNVDQNQNIMDWSFNTQKFIETAFYIMFHIEEHPSFSFPIGYRRPTTDNTFPVALRDVQFLSTLFTNDFFISFTMRGYQT
jgi:hypothetical protein